MDIHMESPADPGIFHTIFLYYGLRSVSKVKMGRCGISRRSAVYEGRSNEPYTGKYQDECGDVPDPVPALFLP